MAKLKNHLFVAVFSMSGSIAIGYLQSLIW